MLVKMVQVKFDYTSGKYALEEIGINPEHVVSVVEERKVSQEIRVYEAKRPEGLDSRVSTSTVLLTNGHRFTVIGAPDIVLEKLSNNSRSRKTVLRG